MRPRVPRAGAAHHPPDLRRRAEAAFSATLDSGVAALVDEFLVDPAVHEVAGEDQASSSIEHRVFVIGNHEKRDIVAELANREGKTLVFSRTRAFAEETSPSTSRTTASAPSHSTATSTSRAARATCSSSRRVG